MDSTKPEATVADAARTIDALCAAIVDVCWRQWGALGQAAARPPRTIVDIEALLLASQWFAEDEPRLTSAAAAWLRKWDSLVSMQRLRNLAARTAEWLPASPFMDTRVRALSVFESSPASYLDGGDDKITSPVEEATAPAVRAPARRVSPAAPVGPGAATLQLRLRLLLGVGAKADCMTLLLGRFGDETLPDWCLEQETAYGSHALRKVTRDLAWSGVLASSRDGQHGLRDREAWWPMLHVTPPRRQVWVSWGTIFSWAAACRGVIRRGVERDVSAYGLGGRLENLAASLGGPMPWDMPLRALGGEQLMGVGGFVARCDAMLSQLREDA